MSQIDPSVIGKRIAQGRHEKGLTQSAFADLLAVTQQTVAKWELSQSLPDIFMIAKIGEVIGQKDICYFLGKDMCSCRDCECCGH